MKFIPLFQIGLRRGGITPTLISDKTLFLQPTAGDASGVRALQRHRLLVRPQLDGLVVLTGLAEDGTPFLSLADLRLRFDLCQSDPMVSYALDLSSLLSLRHPSFRNVPSALELQLAERTGIPTVPSLPSDLISPQPPSPANRLAWVEIGSINSAWIQAPPSFFLTLQPRQVRWVYYVVTKRTDKIPSISDSVPARAFDFDVTPLAATSSELAQDLVAQALVADNPQAKLYRLCSKRSPPSDGNNLVGLRLLLDGQRYISDLPPPPANQLISLPVLNSQPQDAIYRVIRL